MKRMSNPNPNSSLINLMHSIALENGHVERLIRSIRRESLDPVIVFGEAHLRRILKRYASYHNLVPTHLSLNKNAPDFRRTQGVGTITAIPLLGGLYHQ